MRLIVMTAAALTLSACASTGGTDLAGSPDLSLAAGQPAPPQARLYADCIAQAAGASTFDRDRGTLRFTCTGAPAAAFHAALGPRSARIGSEYAAGGRTIRTSNALQRDLSGVDHCSVDAAGGDARCVVVLNVGEFLND